VARRQRRPLRFSKSGEPAIERLYRTHWVSPELSQLKRQRRGEKVSAETATAGDDSVPGLEAEIG
jgi:hypothetical protein